MKYSEEFKQKVLSVYGDSKDIRQMLESGDPSLGIDIENAIYGRFGGVSAQEIVEACESKNYQALYEKSKRQLALSSLYYELWEMHQKQNNNGMHRK